MTSGYDAGSIMPRVTQTGDDFATEAVFDWVNDEWSSAVHTPILYQDHLFAVSRDKRGLLTCLDLAGKTAWNSRGQATFELGSFILADGLLFILEGKTGMLRLLDVNAAEYRELDRAQVLHGHDVWGPMALSNGKLVLRDMTKMVCIEVGHSATAGASAPEHVESGALVPEGRRNIAQGASPGYETVVAHRALEGRRKESAGTYASVALPGLAPKGGADFQGLAPLAMFRRPAGAQTTQPTLKYRKLRVIDTKGSGQDQFMEELRGLAVDAEDHLYAVGDSKVVVYSPTGEVLRSWKTERKGYSIAVAADGTVYVGQGGQVQLFDRAGKPRDTWRDEDRIARITAIGLTDDAVLLADLLDRCILRYDRHGKFVNKIGKDNRRRGFLLPNQHLDFAVDRDGVIHACNPGQHRVQRFTLDGKRVSQFGHFDGRDPAGFTGCCNPTNIALTPDGHVVTVEKAKPRVKIYNKDGELLAVVAEGDFDPGCKNMDVAVDSRGRIYVVDTVRLRIIVYEPVEKKGAGLYERVAPASSRCL
ncbi:MAG: NHL repeat-containing protein [Phycisphaerae bacterium]|nr:NHL repeat-containing protein [Phycisphaerae bacterium]